VTNPSELIAKARAYVQPSLDRDLWNPGLQSVLDVCNALEAALPKTVSTVEELIMLPIGSVFIGPERYGEVFQKDGDVEFATVASRDVWLASNLVPRGPFTILFTPTETEGN
jgi:hypothetical protein